MTGKVRRVTTQPYKPKVGHAHRGPVIRLVIGADRPGLRVLSAIPDSLKDEVVDNNTNPCL